MKPVLQLIAKDYHGTRESWQWLAVIHYTGELERDSEGSDTISEDQITDLFRFLEGYEIFVRPAGSGVPGQSFAHEPHIQYFPRHLVITQSGGLDI